MRPPLSRDDMLHDWYWGHGPNPDEEVADRREEDPGDDGGEEGND